MYLQTTDILAIIIALLGACIVMFASFKAHRQVLEVNRELIKTIRILQSAKKKEQQNTLDSWS